MPQPPPPEDNLSAGLVVKPVKTSPVSQRQSRRSLSPLRQWLRLGGLTLLLAGAGTLVGLSLWTSVMVMLRPQPPRWLGRYWPGLTYHWGDLPVQTLTEIAAELNAQQRYAGEFMELPPMSNHRETSPLKLLPVFATRSPCSRDCEAIVELRLYGEPPTAKSTDQLQLLDQLTVQGPAESEVLQSLSPAQAHTVGSTYQLPLTALKSIHEGDLPGTWLTLTGRWRTQGSPVLYGQILYVNPQTRRLTSLLNWQSPPGRLPAWHDVDHQGLPELLVNQSYSLEPSFKLYRIDNLQAVGTQTRLEEIALTPLSKFTGQSAIAYQNALFLAQRGLWSDAQSRLSQLKAQRADDWSAELERQFQLVTLHARFGAAQAERDWSQPSQKLLALLLDGRWQAALQPVNAKQQGYPEAVLPLLERDSARVWQRLTATLKLNPNHKEAQFWSALVLMAKEDEDAALKWLAADEKSPLRQEFTAIAQTVAPSASSTVSVTTTAPAKENESDAASATTASPLWDGLIGEATGVGTPDAANWQRPSNAPNWSLSPGQQWFTITLQSGYKRQQWQRPLNLSASTVDLPLRQLWQTLGLGASATLHGIDLTSGNRQTLEVMGARWQGQRLTLLARGIATPHPLMVTTPGLWNEAATLTPVSLASVLQSQPAVGDRLLLTLQNHMGFEPASLTTTLQQQVNAVPPWATVQRVNLVDDATAELLVNLSPALITAQGLSPVGQNATQLLVTTQGELLYSNLWTGSTAPRVVGWVQPASGLPVLVVTAGDRPEFRYWSPQNRQFQ